MGLHAGLLFPRVARVDLLNDTLQFRLAGDGAAKSVLVAGVAACLGCQGTQAILEEFQVLQGHNRQGVRTKESGLLHMVADVVRLRLDIEKHHFLSTGPNFIKLFSRKYCFIAIISRGPTKPNIYHV